MAAMVKATRTQKRLQSRVYAGHTLGEGGVVALKWNEVDCSELKHEPIHFHSSFLQQQ